MFRDQYKNAVDEIEADQALLKKILSDASSKKPPVYKKRMIRTLSAAAASVAVIFTGILTIPSLMNVFRTPDDVADYEFHAFIDENADKSADNDRIKNNEASPSPPPSSPSLFSADKDASCTPSAKPKGVFSFPPATRQPEKKSAGKVSTTSPSSKKDAAQTKTPVPATAEPQATASAFSPPVYESAPPMQPTAPPITEETPPPIPSFSADSGSLQNNKLMDSDTQDRKDSSESSSVEDSAQPLLGALESAKQQNITLRINLPAPAAPGSGATSAGGGGGSAFNSTTAVKEKILNIDEYCSYLGVDVTGKILLPAGMQLVSASPVLSYSEDKLVSDRFTFSYHNSIQTVSITTSKLDQSVVRILNSMSYEKSYINGIDAVIILNDHTYTAYLRYMDVSFTVYADHITEEELSLLLSSLTMS